jgi:chitin-binding protein
LNAANQREGPAVRTAVAAALAATLVMPAAPLVQHGFPAAPDKPACRAEATATASWDGGYLATVRITNTGGQPLNGWFVSWMVPLGTLVNDGWNGNFMQGGPVAMAHAPDWSQTLDPGATAVTGYTATSGTAPSFSQISCG